MEISDRKRQIFLIYLLAFVCAIGNPVILPCLPSIMGEFQLSPMEMGLTISVFALPGMIIIPLNGMLSDRLGRRPILLTGLFLAGLGSVLCYFSNSLFWLLVGRAIQGMSLTPLEAMTNTLVSDLFRGRERMKYISRATAMQFFSCIVVPLISSALLLLGGWRMAFVFAGFLTFGAFLICLPMKVYYTPSRSVTLRQYGNQLRTLLSSRRVLQLFSLRIISAMLMFGVVYPHLSLLLTDRLGLPAESFGTMFAIFAIAMCFGSMMLSWIAARMRSRTIGLLAGSLLTLAMVLFAEGSTLAPMVIALAFAGVGMGILSSSSAGHTALAATPDTRGTIMSAYSTTFRASQTIAPVIFGLVFQYRGFDGLFWGGALVALASTFMAAAAFHLAETMEQKEAGAGKD